MLEFVAKHKTFPEVEIYPFEDFNKAYKRLLKEKPKYRCVLKI